MNEEEGAKFMRMLLDNVDSKGESIVSDPYLPSRLVPMSDSYFSMSSLSLTQTMQDKIAKSLDLPKWNEITFMVFLQEGLAKAIGKHTDFQVIHSDDLWKEIAEDTDGWQEELNETLREKVVRIIMKDDKADSEDKPLLTVNASFFFTLLFTDRYLTQRLTMEQNVLLGNALTLAVWKERWECDLLSHPETRDKMQQFLTYASGNEEYAAQSAFFNKFCKIDMKKSHNYLDTRTSSDLMTVFTLSPWCGFESVLQMMEGMRDEKQLVLDQSRPSFSQVKRSLLALFKDTPKMDIIRKSIMSVKKRRMEHQMLLVELQYTLASVNKGEKKSGIKTKRLMQQMQRIIHTNVAIDSRGGLALYTQKGMQLVDSLKQNQWMRDEMGKVDSTLREYAASAIADVMSRAGQKMLHNAMHYFLFIPFAMHISSGKAGLFISFARMAHRMLQKVGGLSGVAALKNV